MSNECNESEVKSIKQFLISYDCGKSVDNCNTKESPTQDSDGFTTTDSIQASVVMRNNRTTDSCAFADHMIAPNDVECELFDWIFYHLEYKKCPYSLAVALAVIVSRKLGLAETASHESQSSSNTDNSRPALSSNELYSQSLEYLTEYINHWKENPEIAVEVAKEYSGKTFLSSVNAIKNTRRKMEDRHVILHDLNKALNLKVPKQYSYYAIFDGHAGVDAASYSAAHIHHNLVKSQAFLDGDITGAFKEAFSLTDLHYLERSAREGKKSGSTALCALLEGKSKLYLAWLGDSQAILVKNGKPIDIMIPHKPEREEERKRIEDLGGFVAYVDTWRVSGTLAVSRAIGDPEHKPYISSEPDVKEIDLDSDDDFLILACDGLWDQLTPEEATTLVYQYICEHENQNTQEIEENVAFYLSKIAKEEGSSDNITTVVLFFKDLSQLMATPFTPLTPRERSLTSEFQPNGQLNGINSTHFQFSDSQYEYMQSTANPFESGLSNSMAWDTPSPFDDTMNRAKLNIEVNESINFENTNDSNEMSNPFNEFIQQTPDNTNSVGITNESQVESHVEGNVETNVEGNVDVHSSQFSIESLSREQLINPFDETDKQTNFSYESYSQPLSSTDNSNLIAVETDTRFIDSNISHFSTQYPASQTDQLDPELCSTPLQSQQLIEDSFNSIIREDNISEKIMDFSTDENEEFCSFKQNDSEPHIVGAHDIDQKHEIISVSNEMNSDMDLNERALPANESYGNSDIEGNSSLERTEWETAQSILTNEMQINNEVVHNFEDQMSPPFDNQEQSTIVFNQNQEFQDLSSGNESVDSIVYEKVGFDSDFVPKISETDEVLLTTDNAMTHDVIEDKNIISSEDVVSQNEIYPQSTHFETPLAENSYVSMDSKSEQCLVENVLPQSEINSCEQPIETKLEEYSFHDENEMSYKSQIEPEIEISEDILSKASNELSETVETNAESILLENIESISSEILSTTVESNTEEASNSTTNESKFLENSIEIQETPYIALENTDLSENSKTNAEELLLLEDTTSFELNTEENFSLHEESKESLLSDAVESKPSDLKPEESLQLNNELKPSEDFSQVLDCHQKDILIAENVDSKPEIKSPVVPVVPSKATKAVPSKTVNKTTGLSSKPSASTTTNKPIASNKAKPLPSEKLATKQTTGTVRPKTVPISANNSSSRPTVRTTTTTTTSALAPKSSGPSKPLRPSESRVSASRLTSTNKPSPSAPRTLASKATDIKPSAPKTQPSKPSTVSRATTATTGRTSSTTRTANTSATTTKPSTTNSSLLSRKTGTQSTSTASNLRPKTSAISPINKVNETKTAAGARPQTSTLKSVTSKIDTGRAVSASNKTTLNSKPVSKTTTLQTKAGVKPISVKGENKVSVVSKTNSLPKTTNGFSSTINKHNNPLNVPKPLKQELEDADLLSQPMNSLSIETKRSETFSPTDQEITFSSPDAAEIAFMISKTDSLNLSESPNTNGFEASPIDSNQ